MPIIKVPEADCESREYERLVPGSRVEYRGTSWKIVGMYFVHARERAGDGLPAPAGRTKHLILQSLSLAPEALQHVRTAESS